MHWMFGRSTYLIYNTKILAVSILPPKCRRQRLG